MSSSSTCESLKVSMSLYRTSSKIALSVGVGYRYPNDAKFHEFNESQATFSIFVFSFCRLHDLKLMKNYRLFFLYFRS